MSHTLELPGLHEDNPRDFLAALGLLAWMDFLFTLHQPRLTWAPARTCPVIHTSEPLPEDWSMILLHGIRSWQEIDPNPFGHGKVEGISEACLREILAATTEPRLIRFYCGITSQVTHEKGGRRSGLIIESANRSVLKGVNELLSNKRQQLDLGADLRGAGIKREVGNTSRWHPAEYQPAAHAATDPEDNKHRDWVGLNVLALFGTAFYPVVERTSSRATSGLRRQFGSTQFCWPVWEVPLTSDAVQTLLTHPAVFEDLPDISQLARLGIKRLWRSRKFTKDQNDYFSTAEPAF